MLAPCPKLTRVLLFECGCLVAHGDSPASFARTRVELSPLIGKTFPATKERAVAYLWPLLDPDQDVNTPSARLAFHLHRLRASATALTCSGLVANRNDATLLLQARITLSNTELAALALALDTSPHQLTRALTPDEDREWLFYRVSAQNRALLWQRAQTLWHNHGLSQRAAARIMGYSPSHVSRALKDDPTQKQKVLSLPPAERLTRTIGLPEGVAYFLEDLIPDQTLDK